jgi:hypothetical protein
MVNMHAICLLLFAVYGCSWGEPRMATSAVVPSEAAASYVAGQDIKFESLWSVPAGNLKRIGAQIVRYVRERNRGDKGDLMSSIAPEIDKYFAECVGINIRGDRQIFCNVIRHPTGEIRPQSEAFTGLFDGGVNTLKVILAPTLDVIYFETQDRLPRARRVEH